MNVGQLEEILKNVNDKSIDVMIVQSNDEFKFSQAEKAKVKGVRFGSSEIPKNEQPVINCLVITDEI